MVLVEPGLRHHDLKKLNHILSCGYQCVPNTVLVQIGHLKSGLHVTAPILTGYWIFIIYPLVRGWVEPCAPPAAEKQSLAGRQYVQMPLHIVLMAFSLRANTATLLAPAYRVQKSELQL